MVKEVEGVIRLNGQLRERACELQRAEVADHDAVHADVIEGSEELLELSAFAAHGRARCIHDDVGASCCVAHERLIVAQRPRTLRKECLAADVDRVSTCIDGGARRLEGADADTQTTAGFVFLCDRRLLAQHLVGKARLLDRLTEEARLALTRHADVDCRRLSKCKCGRVVAHAVFVEAAPALLIRRIAVRIGNVGVDGGTVGGDEAADELRRAHPPLDFERKDARLYECGDGTIHAHILECQLVRPGAGRVEHLSRLLVDEGKRPAADLHAASAVAALPEENARVDALPALGDAHIAVHEVLHFDARARTEEGKLGERHLTADHDARDAVFLELFDGVFVMRIHHDRGVQGHGDAHLVHELEHGKVLYENRIGADLLQIGEIVAQSRQLLVADEVIEGYVEVDVMGVGVVNRLLEPCVVEVEIALVQAHIEMFAAQIDGVRAGINRCRHGIPCAGRRKQFDGFTV